MKKPILFLSIFLLLVIGCKKFISGPESCDGYDYSDCNTAEPILTEAKLNFTINDKVKMVPFIIYKGNIEDGQPLFFDTAKNESEVYYNLEFGRYSVKAEYRIDGKTIYAVDGGMAEKWDGNVCDSNCWFWDSLNLDLRLK